MTEQVRIMVVEDDTSVAAVLSARLEYFGYQVTGVAKSGPMALKQFKNYPPDLILMDILLEGDMNGLEVAERISSESDIPIIFLSCLSDQEIMRRAIETKPFAFLVKPYDTAELRFTIENTLLKYRAQKEREKLIIRLESALLDVKRLSGLLPICSVCKKIKDTEGRWHQIESYIATHSEADFSHGICPQCTRKFYPEFDAEAVKGKKASS
jgi:CheY-like chemotaxis protein